MRELKFRAWSLERKCYVDIWEITFDDEELPGVLSFEYGGLLYKEPVHNFIIEQYTGLKDKNDKEVYEGDIVDYNDDGECIGVVEYDAPEFYLDADATNWARMFLKGAPHQKVIGNIHENPELLGEKE